MEEFADHMLEVVFLPWELAKGRGLVAKMLAVTVGWLWILPMMLFVAGPVIMLTVACDLWSSLD